MSTRRTLIAAAGQAAGLAVLPRARGAEIDPGKPPVLIGLDGEFGHASGGSAEAILQGTLIAIEDINARGGVLGGRRLEVVKRANHTVPARSVANLREFAAMPDLVAAYCGRFSPTVLECVPEIHRLQLPLLNPWAAADAIVDNGQRPNYVFRLSLKDSWAAPAMLRHLAGLSRRRVGLLMLNTSWGRSTQGFAESQASHMPGMRLVGTQWINWDDSQASMLAKYQLLRDSGANALLLTANAEEAKLLCRALLALPPAQRMPVASHWGVSGGDLPGLVGTGFHELEFAVVQTYSFIGDNSATARRVVATHNRLFGTRTSRDIVAAVGVAHAHDLTQLLASALDLAGSTRRGAVRDALEHVPPHQGVIKRYAPAFTPARHEALDFKDVFMARYDPQDGALERIRVA